MQNIILISLVVFIGIILAVITIYISSKNKQKNKKIKYAKHIEILYDLQWEYDRKLGAYRFFIVSALTTSLFIGISVVIFITQIQIALFHILTMAIIMYSIYYNYLNRDALLDKIEVKATYEWSI